MLVLSSKQGETRVIPKQAARYGVCWEIRSFGWTYCFPLPWQFSIVAEFSVVSGFWASWCSCSCSI